MNQEELRENKTVQSRPKNLRTEPIINCFKVNPGFELDDCREKTAKVECCTQNKREKLRSLSFDIRNEREMERKPGMFKKQCYYSFLFTTDSAGIEMMLKNTSFEPTKQLRKFCYSLK